MKSMSMSMKRSTTLAATTPAKRPARPLKRLARLGGRALLVVPGAIFQAAEYTGEVLIGAASVAVTVGRGVLRATRAHGRRVLRGKAKFA